jgi:hypothetical protein
MPSLATGVKQNRLAAGNCVVLIRDRSALRDADGRGKAVLMHAAKRYQSTGELLSRVEAMGLEWGRSDGN